MSILTVEGLKKTYTTRFGGTPVEALKNVNFSVERGEYVAIMGESGSGYPTIEPRCQMCMELYDGSLKDNGGYVVYDMYYNA